jgi:hypothetical protein
MRPGLAGEELIRQPVYVWRSRVHQNWLFLPSFVGAREAIFACYRIQTALMNRKIPIGILGATGVVGQRFIQMLELMAKGCLR